MEAVAAEAAASSAASALSLGEFGLAGTVIAVLLYLIVKGFGKWFDSAQKREDRDAEIRKAMYQSFETLSAALTRNSNVTEQHSLVIRDMTMAVGKLPCTHRDPGLRTRSTDGYGEIERSKVVG